MENGDGERTVADNRQMEGVISSFNNTSTRKQHLGTVNDSPVNKSGRRLE